jgi:oligopeptide transport system ATP-binding protein
MPDPVLEVDDLRVAFQTDAGTLLAVDGVSYTLGAGEILAVLGESGSGKTVHARAIMRILDTPPAEITGGSVRLEGEEVLALREDEMRDVRGARIAMLFQDPHVALDPVFPVGDQLVEVLRRGAGVPRRDARQEALALLERVGIASPRQRWKAYPHQLSGGIAQRVMIALAVALRPTVLLADEPTSSLDVTVQAQVLELLAALVREHEMAMVLITHNLAVAAGLARRIAVMYAGRVVEIGPARAVYEQPRHPYTAGLLRSIPDIVRRTERLPVIEGSPPNLLRLPTGCAFHPRCPLATDRCRLDSPALDAVGPGRSSACFHADEVAT